MLTSLPIWVCVLWLLNSARRYQFPHSGSSLTLVTLNAGTMMGRRRFEPRPDVLASLCPSGLLRIHFGPFATRRTLVAPLLVLRRGKSGPAQIRTTPRRARFAVPVWSTSNPLWPIFPPHVLVAPLLVVVRWEKWAGADSNCGYGHPKAEGYQATPPARTRTVVRRAFNPSETASLPPVPPTNPALSTPRTPRYPASCARPQSHRRRESVRVPARPAAPQPRRGRPAPRR